MAAEPFLTRHAILRYQQRVATLSEEEIARAIDCPAVRRAIEIGAPFVRLGGGQRLVLDGPRIVTVLPRGHRPQRMSLARFDFREGRDAQS